MTVIAIVLGLAAALVTLAVVGGGRRARQADAITDLTHAEDIHAKAAMARAEPIPDADAVLRAHGRLRDD